MAAYYKVEVSLNTNSVTVGSPSAQEVLVTLPLVGPAGATGPQGPAGAGAVESVNGQTGVVVLDATDVGAAETLHASEHEIGGSDVLELDSQQVLVDSVFLSTAAPNLAGIYLRNGSDNSKPLYENSEYRTYFWWDSDLSKWFLASSTDVNIFESSSNTTFPWQATSWSPISPQTGSIDVDQAQLFDVSDQSIGNPSLLRTAKSGNATSTELVLGSDTRLTNSRTPSSTLAHASSHHTGGTDAIAPNNIGAGWEQVLSDQFISGDTLLSAGRNRRITLSAINQTVNVDLPYESNENGDTATLIASSGLFSGSTLSIRTASNMSGGVPVTYFTLATLSDNNQSFTFVSNGTATGWSLRAVDTHTQAASTITGLGTAATANLDALPETLRIVGSADATKKLAFELDTLVSTATTRTLTVPNSSGTIALNETFAAPPAIGNTTPAAGTFTTLSANNGTLTASAPVLDLAQTWNNAAVTFTGLLANFTNTASAALSRLIDLQVGGTSQFNVTRTGIVRASRYDFPDSDRGIRNNGTTRVDISDVFQFVTGGGATGNFVSGVNSARAAIRLGGTNDSQGVSIKRDGADHILAQESTTNPQTYRIYNTFTDANNHERGFMRWSSNVLQIGTEKAGTGSARALELQTDGTTRLTVAAAGNVGIGTLSPTHELQVIGGCDNSAVGPVVVTAPAGANLGVALSLRANNLTGGRTYSFLATGPGSFGGAGDFAVYGSGAVPAAGYVFRANATGQYIAGFNKSSYLGQISAFPVSAATKGIVIQGFASQTANLLECQNSGSTVLASISSAGAGSLVGLTLTGDLTISTKDIVTDTTTGTKIGTATTQKIGFFNATPVVQQAAVADATDAASTQARLNDLLARVRTLGLIAA